MEVFEEEEEMEKVRGYLEKIVGDEEQAQDMPPLLLAKNVLCRKTLLIRQKDSESQKGENFESDNLDREEEYLGKRLDKEVVQIIGRKEEIEDLKNEIFLKNMQNEKIKKLKEKLYEKRLEWEKNIDKKERELKRWKSAFKAKEQEVKDLKSRKRNLIFLPASDVSQIAKLLL